jgi:hypothetical protein
VNFLTFSIFLELEYGHIDVLRIRAVPVCVPVICKVFSRAWVRPRVETKTVFFTKSESCENGVIFAKFRFAKIFVFAKVFVFAKIFFCQKSVKKSGQNMIMPKSKIFALSVRRNFRFRFNFRFRENFCQIFLNQSGQNMIIPKSKIFA